MSQNEVFQPLEADENEWSVELFDGSSEVWDQWVKKAPGSTFCHLYGWRRIMSEVLGHETFYYVVRDREGEICGALPLVRVQSLLFGDYLVSMPFLNYGGPLGNREARTALAEAALAQARELGVDLLELRDRVEVPGPLETARRKLTVLLDLPEDPEKLWKEGLKSKVRSQVRRPRKAGMEGEHGHHLLGPFYSVFGRTMRDLGTPVLSRRFFEALLNEFPDQVTFGVIRSGEQPVASGCGFLWRGEFEMTWAGSLREFNRSAPNMLLYWSTMEWAMERGAERFNFGRCTEGSGTHRFKRQWGGTDHPLPWAQWSPRGVTSTPVPDGRFTRMATALWRRLPLWVANGFGPLLSRGLP